MFCGRLIVISIFVIIIDFVVNSVAGGRSEALTELATNYGTPFAESALTRLHGNVFGKGRAARSTDVIIFNKSDREFKLNTNYCTYGGYSTDLFPDDVISPKESIVFGVESNGFAIGVECTTKYTSLDGSYFEVKTSNPYIGKNTIRDEHSPSLQLTSTKGQGDNNQVRWIIEDK